MVFFGYRRVGVVGEEWWVNARLVLKLKPMATSHVHPCLVAQLSHFGPWLHECPPDCNV